MVCQSIIFLVGYQGKLEEKLLAQRLRKTGLSYGEILLQVSVSKDTISRWCKNIVLTDIQKQRLIENKSYGQRKGSLVAADNKRQKRIKNIQLIFEDAKKEVRTLTKRDRFIAGLALYTGEGDKSYSKTGFTNSDPKIIKFMMNWFLEFCDLPLSRYRGAIWIHEGLDKDKAKEYWSDLTGIPTEQFHKTYVAVDKRDSKKVRKNIHNYGIFAIRFSQSATQRKIMGWISALFGGIIPQ